MLIVSAGMPRSASTWLFNVLRLILKDQDRVFESGWVGDMHIDLSKNYLVKIHDYDDFLAKNASFIFYSYRDVRDAIASSNRKFNTPLTMRGVDHFIHEDKNWRSKATYSIRYEDVLVEPLEEITKIIEKLGVECDANIIYKRIQEMVPSNQKGGTYDATTLYHQRHITKGGEGHWRAELDQTLQGEISASYGEWLMENGYNV